MDDFEDLGDGFRLRRATPADTDALIAFHAKILREPDEDSSPLIADWIGALVSGSHPTFSISDFTVIEQIATGDLVSSMSLITETWAYGGIPFDVGRVEFVSTNPDFRRRGLVRRQMEVVHRWSAAKGQLVQVIMGIPTFYRRFGYEMAVELSGGRRGLPFGIPKLAEGDPEPYRIRPATDQDLTFMSGLDERLQGNWLVTSVRDEALLRYELEAPRDPQFRRVHEIIERQDGERIGYLTHMATLWSGRLPVMACEIEPGVSLLEVMPVVIRHLRTTGMSIAAELNHGSFDAISFSFGNDHPIYRALPRYLSRPLPPYAWYVRVPDLPAFITVVAPVLEQRLARSVAAGHSGELVLGSYDGGVRLVFAQGRLETVEVSNNSEADDCAAWFPGLSFLQLLFGYRSLSELEHAFPDCLVNSEDARVLLDALFPKQPSRVWALG